MRKWLFLFGVCLVTVLFSVHRYFSHTVNVNTVLVSVQKFPSKPEVELSYHLFDSLHRMNSMLFRWVGDSFLVTSNMDFGKYDYLLAFGRPLKEAFYYDRRSNPEDACDYVPGLPVSVSFRNTP